MSDQYKYGKRIKNVKNAAGVTGVLIKSGFDDQFYFRVNDKSAPDGFTFYKIRHSDLQVTIHPSEEASFYSCASDSEDMDKLLDHSPQTLGLEKVKDK